jgi:zinc and cadmium transporter
MTYAIVAALFSLAGALIPIRFKLTHARLQIYLSLAAGTLLGAAVFHLLPEAAELTGGNFSLPLAAGIILVFLLQRYVAPHSHESMHDQAADHEHGHHHDACTDVHQHHGTGPFLTGVIAILALSIHSFFDGVALAAAGAAPGAGKALAWSVLLSVVIHKPMDGLSVSVILLKSGVGRAGLWLVQLAYAALVPLGLVAFWMTQGGLTEAAESAFVGRVLAFSGGIFCCIALTDLLPELHFHKHDRHKLTAALLAGMAVMLLTSLIGHEHDEGGAGHAPIGHTHQGK